MNTNQILKTGLLAVGLMAGIGLVPARAGDQTANKLKMVSGSISAVDVKSKVVTLSGFWGEKSFVLGEDCVLSQPEKKQTGLADFHPGQKVEIGYSEVQGIRVAGSISLEELVFAGKITGLDLAKHNAVVKSGMSSRSFTLSDDVIVSMPANAKAGPGDLALGNRVRVIYESPKSQSTARRIEMTSQQYIGTLDGISPAQRTVTASKRLIGGKTFHLAADCTILNNGKLDGHLTDLHVGQEYQLSYETVEGVNIVNCIAPVPSAQAKMEQHEGTARGTAPAN